MINLRLKIFAQVFNILVLFIIIPVNCQDSYILENTNTCNNTIGKSGQCINVKECQTILKLVEFHGNIAKKYLQRFSCGFDSHGPKVCCPIDSKLKYGPLFSPDCGISIYNKNINTNLNDMMISFPSRIAGGTSAELGAWPWMAALGYQSDKNPNKTVWRCGGSLISSRHILTAAHCINMNLFVIRLGEINLGHDDDGATPIDIAIEKTIFSPNYDPEYKVHDIAIVKLKRDVQFTNFIRPICLPLINDLLDENYIGYQPIAIGWGKLGQSSEKAEHLQQVEIPIVSPKICEKIYKSRHVIIDNNTICAGHPEGIKDTCQGDSGGPLILSVNNTFYAIALVSYGIVCGFPDFPGVYTAINRNLDFVISQLN